MTVEADRPISRKTITRAARRIAARAQEARDDPAEFFAFAAREETTRERIPCLPHQRVLLDFVTSHRTSVVRMFVGSSKTYTLGWLGLHFLGCDVTGRGAMIGATEGAASKVLSIPREAIEDERGEFPEVHLTFPELQPSSKSVDPWTQKKIVVERPAGIRDPSWVAIGFSGSLPGARLRWIFFDDVLDEENTATPAARERFNRNFGRKVLTRLDMRDAMICVVNTPWEPDDLTFQLEKAGWPTLSMEVEGEVRFSTVPEVGWYSPLLRPSLRVPGTWRLTAHDSEEFGAPLCEELPGGGMRRVPEGGEEEARLRGAILRHFDIDEEIPLWPAKFGREQIAQIRKNFAATPGEFMAKYKLRPRAPADEAKKRAWVERCKENGRALGHRSLAQSYRGSNPTFTGIDVAVSEEDGADRRAIFTFEQIDAIDFQLPGGGWRRLRNARKILNVQAGLWSMSDFVERIEAEARLFNSMLRVETNGAQEILRQWLLRRDSSLTIEAHVTGKENKDRRVTGVAGVLIELENLAWILPCDEQGNCPEAVELWISELLDYRPDRHPGDVLIASWLAREQARVILGDSSIPLDLATVAERFR